MMCRHVEQPDQQSERPGIRFGESDRSLGKAALLFGAPAWLAKKIADDVADLLSVDRHSSREQEVAEIERGWCVPSSLPPAHDACHAIAIFAEPDIGELKIPMTPAQRKGATGPSGALVPANGFECCIRSIRWHRWRQGTQDYSDRPIDPLGQPCIVYGGIRGCPDVQVGDCRRRARQRTLPPPMVAQHGGAWFAGHPLFDDIGRSCRVILSEYDRQNLAETLEIGICPEGAQRLALPAE